MKQKAYTVAVINSNQDIVDAIRLALSDEGYVTVAGHIADFKRGQDDFIDFIQKHNPDVIIYDIAPPYEQNWKFFQLIRSNVLVKDVSFLVTTTNSKALESEVGLTGTIEILGKPFDLHQITTAINSLLKKRKNITTKDSSLN